MTGLDDASLAQAAPPVRLSRPLAALWWLRKGGFAPGPEWQRAHQLCQEAEGDPAHDSVHALAHWIEGDMGNADYWTRRAGSPRAATVAAEWQRLVRRLGGAGD